MNIDERLEALVQSGELLSRMHQDNEARYDAMIERHDRMFERLVNIAENHERRINGLKKDLEP